MQSHSVFVKPDPSHHAAHFMWPLYAGLLTFCPQHKTTFHLSRLHLDTPFRQCCVQRSVVVKTDLLFVMRVLGCCAAIYDIQMLWGGGRIAHSYWNFMDFFWTACIWNLLDLFLFLYFFISESNSTFSTLDTYVRTLLMYFLLLLLFYLSLQTSLLATLKLKTQKANWRDIFQRSHNQIFSFPSGLSWWHKCKAKVLTEGREKKGR